VDLELLHSAELGVVGLCIVSPAVTDDLGLDGGFFQDARLGKVYGNILHLWEEQNGGGTIGELELADLCGGSEWLSLVADAVSTPCSSSIVEAQAELIKGAYMKRKVRFICADACDRAAVSDDVGDVVEGTIEQLENAIELGLSQRPNLYTEMKQELQDIGDGVGFRQGLPTGVGLEKIVPGGYPRDKVTVLFGETGTFKSTLKANSVDAIAMSGEGIVLDFSLEDSNQLTRQKALARASGVPYAHFATREFTEEDKHKLNCANKAMLEAAKNIVVIGDVPPTASEIIRTARQYKRQGLVAVVVDYITMLDWGGRDEREMLSDAMLKFQRAAKRDGVAFIVVSQLASSRLHSRDRADRRPELRDLFGSSAVANACKLAVATYRPSKYDPKPSLNSTYGEMYARTPNLYQDVIELIVRKNVLGPSDKSVRVICDCELGLMKPYEERVA
jgi:replicative DNA helicase